jgi:hypothetical protein
VTGQPLCRPSLLEKKPRLGFVRSTFSAVVGSEVMRTPTASSMALAMAEGSHRPPERRHPLLPRQRQRALRRAVHRTGDQRPCALQKQERRVGPLSPSSPKPAGGKAMGNSKPAARWRLAGRVGRSTGEPSSSDRLHPLKLLSEKGYVWTSFRGHSDVYWLCPGLDPGPKPLAPARCPLRPVGAAEAPRDRDR